MGAYIGCNKKARVAYGFGEVALIPGNIAVDPKDIDVSMKLGKLKFDIPILASAMDGVVDTKLDAAIVQISVI